MTDALLPCPFCGNAEPFVNVIEPHTHAIATFMPDHPGSSTVECGACSAALIEDTKEQAIEAWNRRAPSAAPAPAEAPPCKADPRAPHGYLRNASHDAGRDVCECEAWEPPAAAQPAPLLGPPREPIRTLAWRLVYAQGRMLDKWADGDENVKRDLWRNLHAAGDALRDALNESGEGDCVIAPNPTGAQGQSYDASGRRYLRPVERRTDAGAKSMSDASGDAIGDRFKAYERVFDYSLPRRLPMVIRVDGRAFHGIPLTKPFDHAFFACMAETARVLCGEIQGSVLAYFQSDEISIIARDDMTNTTQPWVGKRLSKVVSLSAAIATAAFNRASGMHRQFDSRAFIVPDLNEVTNYLIWRQQDATRNSVSMAARALFSHAQCAHKTTPQMIDMQRAAGLPWEETPTRFKRGAVCRPVTTWKEVPQTGELCERREWQIDEEPPIFTTERGYIEALYDAAARTEGTEKT